MKITLTDEQNNTITLDHEQSFNMVINDQRIQERFIPCNNCGKIILNEFIVQLADCCCIDVCTECAKQLSE